jgi:hypothetical protein
LGFIQRHWRRPGAVEKTAEEIYGAADFDEKDRERRKNLPAAGAAKPFT